MKYDREYVGRMRYAPIKYKRKLVDSIISQSTYKCL